MDDFVDGECPYQVSSMVPALPPEVPFSQEVSHLSKRRILEEAILDTLLISVTSDTSNTDILALKSSIQAWIASSEEWERAQYFVIIPFVSEPVLCTGYDLRSYY